MQNMQSKIHLKRPTSPHLSVYRWQISNSLSILHRLTGVALFFGLTVICWWGILSVFSTYHPYIIRFTSYCCFKLAAFAIVFALFYHLLNGIRHLFWDAGYGFEIKSMNITGWLVMIFSLVLTALTAYCVSNINYL